MAGLRSDIKKALEDLVSNASDLDMLAALEETPSSVPHFQCCFIAAVES